MKEHYRLLKNLGLNEAETRVYVSALELGKALPLHLARQAHVKRPMLYKILPSLLEKGLLSETMRGKRRYLVAEDPEKFVERKKQDIFLLEQSLPQLRSIMNSAGVRPAISVYEGIEGVKKIYTDVLKTKDSNVLNFMNLERIHPDIEKYAAEYFIPERIRKKISLKVLLSGSIKHGKIHLFSDRRDYREVRVVSDKNFPILLDGFIYGSSTAFALYRQDSEPMGVIIHSPEITTSVQSLFDLAWQTAEPVGKE